MSILQVKRILVVVAMHGEAEPIINALNLKSDKNHKFDPRLSMEVFVSEKTDKPEIMLLTNGINAKHGVDKVATQAAAITTWEGIKAFKPDLVINAGTAGGLLSDVTHIGDVYVSAGKVCYFDRQIPIDKYDVYGVGSFSPLVVDTMIKQLCLKCGSIATSNSLVAPVSVLKDLVKQGFCLKEMEAAAVAEVCEMTSTPFLAVKVITNLAGADEKVAEGFDKNFKKALDGLSISMTHIIGYIKEHPNFEA